MLFSIHPRFVLNMITCASVLWLQNAKMVGGATIVHLDVTVTTHVQTSKVHAKVSYITKYTRTLKDG